MRFSNRNTGISGKDLRDAERTQLFHGLGRLKQSQMYLDSRKLKLDYSFPFRQLRNLLNQNVFL
jgi:hypothetical protein